MIIAFEGADNTGKTKLSGMLAEKLGWEDIKFPNEDFDSGKRIRRMLNGEDPFDPEYSQDLQNENKFETLSTLKPGNYIFDRFKLSEIVYGLANGIPEPYVRNLADWLPTPDITFLIVGKSYGQDTDVYGNDTFQSKIKDLFMAEAKNSPGRIEIINNEKSIEAVSEEIMGKLRGIL